MVKSETLLTLAAIGVGGYAIIKLVGDVSKGVGDAATGIGSGVATAFEAFGQSSATTFDAAGDFARKSFDSGGDAFSRILDSGSRAASTIYTESAGAFTDIAQLTNPLGSFGTGSGDYLAEIFKGFTDLKNLDNEEKRAEKAAQLVAEVERSQLKAEGRTTRAGLIDTEKTQWLERLFGIDDFLIGKTKEVVDTVKNKASSRSNAKLKSKTVNAATTNSKSTAGKKGSSLAKITRASGKVEYARNY